MNLKNTSRRIALMGMVGVSLVALVACSDTEDDGEAAATEAAPAAGMEITDVWARATAGNPGENTAIYARITNGTAEDDVLVAVQVGEDVAARTEVHEMVQQGNNMVMQELASGLPVIGGADAVLEPGGYHVMLLNVPTQLTVGQTFPATFVFQNAGEVQVQVEVREASATGSMGGMNQ